VALPSLSCEPPGSGLGVLLSVPPLTPMCDDPTNLVRGAAKADTTMPKPEASGPLLRVATTAAGLPGTAESRGTDPAEDSLPGWSDARRVGGGGSWLVEVNWTEGALPCVPLLLVRGGSEGASGEVADGRLGRSGGTWPAPFGVVLGRLPRLVSHSLGVDDDEADAGGDSGSSAAPNDDCLNGFGRLTPETDAEAALGSSRLAGGGGGGPRDDAPLVLAALWPLIARTDPITGEAVDELAAESAGEDRAEGLSGVSERRNGLAEAEPAKAVAPARGGLVTASEAGGVGDAARSSSAGSVWMKTRSRVRWREVLA